MRNRKGLTTGKTMPALYKNAKILGDINAIKRGKIGKRFTHRISSKLSASLLSSFVRIISKFLKFK